jgi:hypothetical protein
MTWANGPCHVSGIVYFWVICGFLMSAHNSQKKVYIHPVYAKPEYGRVQKKFDKLVPRVVEWAGNFVTQF